MNEEQKSLLLESSSRFLLSQGVKVSYGTAGFREDASILSSTVYRVGILAALRSLKTQSVIGVMITASHNKFSDNGVKIADPNGGMLSQHWEPFADKLANAPSPQQLLQLINEFVEKERIPFDGVRPAEILLGRDTRPSGEALLEAARQGVTSIVGAVASDMGILTTPQLHWMVRARNKGIKASEQDYFEQLTSSFRCLMDLIPTERKVFDGVNDKLVVDGANGVGGAKLRILHNLLNVLDMEVRNSSEDEGVLNDGVGADYVQKEKVAPRGFGSKDAGTRCASLDGDADRLVYFSVPPESNAQIDLVDGDKILSLFAVFIREQLSLLNEKEDIKNCGKARLGIVQTAYANGASTNYLKNLDLEVNLTPTGVKYLHEKAAEFDIGIYFEANGHGTILFSESFIEWLEVRSNMLSSGSKGSEAEKAALRLLAVSKLINQAVGDALSGVLLVEVILKHMGWSIHRWNELYIDLPSRQLKVKVADRTSVVTANAETVVVSPPGLQEAINAETAKYNQGRCFVRPSGTEDVVRVYAEASTQEAADTLANGVAKLVDQFLG
ncbi:putative phosphoacetylglucosamine mutase [Medicago truncatula]|uniref:Phosphoacetylglucosamine mutase n=1 Tax=Medicago truncatula TaxID=3880 RepID=G7JZT7_MEDTR|nr:phosphoacetylglucosamine mutase [Medicago truncatula]XP_039690326.1 phosphoacetylglucosamine mutase [Medicago truncatula]AES94391.1 phosphogluco-mutase [Medicago truncatula]RHN53837.1 putative phosphoacetylglucosamine mutase [Medicago truncatula]